LQIEVIDWVGEDLSQKNDLGIIRYQIQKGEGYASPNDGAMVEGTSRLIKPFILFFSPGATTPIWGCILQPGSGL